MQVGSVSPTITWAFRLETSIFPHRPFVRNKFIAAANLFCPIDLGEMDIESNGKLSESNLESDDLKEDLGAPTVIANAKRVPDRRLVWPSVNSSYDIV